VQRDLDRDGWLLWWLTLHNLCCCFEGFKAGFKINDDEWAVREDRFTIGVAAPCSNSKCSASDMDNHRMFYTTGLIYLFIPF